MDDTLKKITTVIEEALITKTFSLEIIGRIKEIRDAHEKQAGELITAVKLNENLAINYNKERERADAAVARLAGVEKRENDVTAREKSQDIKDVKNDFYKNWADKIEHLFGIVFKNPVVRESVYKNASGYNGGQSTNTSENGGRTIEKE